MRKEGYRKTSIFQPRYALEVVHETALALDPGITTGWALWDKNKMFTSGTMTFNQKKREGIGIRYISFKNWLTEMDQMAESIDVVFFKETNTHPNINVAHSYGGFVATLTAWCEISGIDYQGVPINMAKRYIADPKNIDHQTVKKAVKAKQLEESEPHEADALALLFWAIETNGGKRK